jgi:hypothetical protein
MYIKFGALKNDQLGKTYPDGYPIARSVENDISCPMKLLQRWKSVSKCNQEDDFIFPENDEGIQMKSESLKEKLRQIAQECGYNAPERIYPHSIRIGSATFLVMTLKVPVEEVAILGRWKEKSSTYIYLRLLETGNAQQNSLGTYTNQKRMYFGWSKYSETYLYD